MPVQVWGHFQDAHRNTWYDVHTAIRSERPLTMFLDPYHTYLSLAAIAIYSPLPEEHDDTAIDSWRIEPLDPLLNANLSTAAWAREKIPAPSQ